MGVITFVLVPLISFVLPLLLLYTSSPYTNTVQFVEYHPPPKLAFEGVLAENTKLTTITRLGEDKLDGPETLAFDKEGNIYTGTADGRIMRVLANSDHVEEFAFVGGRPLGVEFDGHGNLIVCDSLKGLLSVDSETRQVTVLTAHVGDSPIFYCDDLEIAKSGKIYFTDATNIAPIQRGSRWLALTPSVVAILANDPTGRLLEYDPETRVTKVLLDGMVFANGVALSNDEEYVLVAETGRPSIRRYYLSGPKAGKSDYFVENLPAIPDGVSIGKDGRVYVCFYSLRSPVEFIHAYPLVKKVLVAFLPFIPIVPQPVGFVAVLDKQGNYVETLWDPTGKQTASLTHFEEHDGKWYFGSLTADWISVYDPKQRQEQ